MVELLLVVAEANKCCENLNNLKQWYQTDPVKGHVAAGFHSNLIQIRCVLAWLE